MATENSELSFQGVSSFDLFFFFFYSCLLGFFYLVCFFPPSPMIQILHLLNATQLSFLPGPIHHLINHGHDILQKKDCQKSINKPLNVGVN